MEIEKLLQDPEFAGKVSAAADCREICEVLRAYGVDATEEDVRAAAAAENAQGELDEATLGSVTGGAFVLPAAASLRLIFQKLPVQIPITLPVQPVTKVML